MKSGVYKIVCIPTGKFYVGSANDILYHWRKHVEPLLVGTHDNPHLQRAWDKYGQAAFRLEVLEYVERDKLQEREQFYLDQLRPYDHAIGFNISKFADAPMRGRVLSKESKAKMSRSRMGKVPSDTTRQRLSQAKKGKYYGQFEQPHAAEARARAWVGRKHTDETRQKMSETAQIRQSGSRCIVTEPDGTEVIVNLAEYCRQKGLSYDCMWHVLGGYGRSYRGHTVRRITNDESAVGPIGP